MPLKMAERERSGQSKGSSGRSGSLNRSQESNVLASLRKNYNDQILLQTQSSHSRHQGAGGVTTGPETNDDERTPNALKYKRGAASPQAQGDAYADAFLKQGQPKSQSNGYDTGALSVENLQTDSQQSLIKSFSQLVQEKGGRVMNPAQHSTAMQAMNANVHKYMTNDQIPDSSQHALGPDLLHASDLFPNDAAANERQLSLLRQRELNRKMKDQGSIKIQ